MGAMGLKSPASRLFTQPFIQAQIWETSKLRVTGLCVGNSPLTGDFPTQRSSNAENVSIWWRHQKDAIKWKYFPSLLALCAGKPPMNNRDAGDLRRHCAHYYVIVMWIRLLYNCGTGNWNDERQLHTPIVAVYADLWARSRYQGQGQVITSHIYCGMVFIILALDTCFWHTIHHLSTVSQTVYKLSIEDCHTKKYDLILMLFFM